MNNTKTDIIETHKMAIEELSDLDPETQMHQLRTANFFLKHRELIGISYASAELLIAEKDIHIVNAAMKIVAAEIVRRGDVTATGFRFTYRKVTENRVRQILHAERLKANPDTKIREPRNAEIMFKCPKCNEEVLFKRAARDNVISFRATELTEDAIIHLANVCNVSRSRLISELLFIERRFGSMRV